MRGLLLALALSSASLLACTSAQAHTQPKAPHVLDHVRTAMVHHEVGPLPVGPVPVVTCTPECFVLPERLLAVLPIEPVLAVPGAPHYVSADAKKPATPPPSK